MKTLFPKYAIICAMFYTSCNFVEVDLPENNLTADVIFLERSTAEAAINNLYAWTAQRNSPNFASGANTIYLGIYADELNTTSTATSYTDFAYYALTSGNSIVHTNFWRTAYEIIYQANIGIAGLQSTTALDAQLKNQLLGEALFIRAFCHFNLVNLFGDVPLITHGNYEENAIAERKAISLVNEQIEKDLLQAHELLSADYPSTGRYRANRYVVSTLLARFYLYTQKWEEAEAYSTEVISAGTYSMPSDLSTVFLSNSTETVWQLALDGSAYTVEGNRLIPNVSATALPIAPLTENLLQSFEAGDTRYSNWVDAKTVNNVTYHYPYKYKVRFLSSEADKTEEPVVFRLAELFLIRSEARAKQNNVQKLQEALDDLNIIRGRADLDNFVSNEQPEIIDAILRERRIEFFAEHGHRWFDLKRTDRLDATLGAKPGWRPEARLFPIPFSEIQKNVFLTQNLGY